ncbi:hypothetical protein [Acinetobacter baumannii]|uniref:hypothetical protein n=1 Tax=Acinetobacter baumannii TaxID=470 RepID=UPI0023402F31|nr:hypothetical protein [Acinetobacter baumannii]
MKISLEIDVPEFDWIDTPTLYRTPIGEFSDIQEVKEIGRLIEYLQRLDEIEWIINSNHQHIRHPFCRELIRDRLRFIPENQIYWFGEKLSYFLQDFEKRTGHKFEEYEYTYQVLSNGKKIQFKTFSMMFDTEEDALRHIAKIYTSRSDFKFAKV